MSRFVKIAAGVAIGALLLGGCSVQNMGDDVYGTIESGKLTMCADVPYAPFEFEDAQSSTGYSGFDVEIVSAIAESLGLTLVVVDSDFDALQSGVTLAAGKCDVAASAMTITDARKANIDFTEPYYDSLQSLLVKGDSGYKTLADLDGKRIGVQTGTTGENYAKENAPAGAEIVSFPSDGELWPAIQARQVDAILQDQPVNFEHTKDGSGYIIIEEYPTDEHYGIAMEKGKNPDLLKSINEALAGLRDNGTYDKIYEKYFG